MQKDGGIIVGVNFDVVSCAYTLLEGLHSSARTFAHRNHGREIGAHLSYFSSRDPGEQIKPVGSDVCDRAHLTAQLRLQAPVPVIWIEQPVLQETAMN